MPTLGVLFSFYTSLAKSLLSLFFGRLYNPQNVPTRDLTGQTAIVTGANSGIGLSIAVALAKQGAAVYLACRNSDRGAAAVEHVVSQCGDKSKERLSFWILDVGDLSSVRAFCQRWAQDGRKIDMMVHNAGIAAPPAGSSTKLREGLPVMYKTNFLGSFLMTHLLESSLSPAARVVMTSSTGSYSATTHFLHKTSNTSNTEKVSVLDRTISKGKSFIGLKDESSAPAYGLSKAQQVLFISLLQEHFSHSLNNERTAHVFTPGFTSTRIFSKFDVTWQTWLTNPLFAALKTTEKWVAVDTDEGAKTGAWLASWGDDLGRKAEGGAFWERMEKRTSLVELMDERRKKEEWQIWERDASVLWDIRAFAG
jgi:NAD(P)-dependent dehydrogenase (short-subunit alcohol dehydrogenase family)